MLRQLQISLFEASANFHDCLQTISVEISVIFYYKMSADILKWKESGVGCTDMDSSVGVL